MSEGQVAALLLWLVLLAFSLNASLLRTLHANPLYQHLCLGGAIVLVPLWTLRAGLPKEAANGHANCLITLKSGIGPR